MKLPSFNAEASVYTTTRHYYAGMASVEDYGGVYPAQGACPQWCIQGCETACRADGESKQYCAKLCQFDCGAYGTGAVVSCGACVGSVQTCTLCGGVMVARSCTSVVCAPGLTNCGGTCGNLSSDSSNCGSCGTVCATGFCCGGVCGLGCGSFCCQGSGPGSTCCPGTPFGNVCCDPGLTCRSLSFFGHTLRYCSP